MIGPSRLATVICVLATAAPSLLVLAQQPGSTGGTIGKTDKSASGGESAHQTGSPSVGTTKRRNEATRSVATSGAVAGRWHWSADCSDGVRYAAEFTLSDVSDGRFTGDFTGGNGDGTISDGSINDKSIAFTRHFFMGTQRWVGQVSAGHIHGSLSGGLTTCTWEASKL